MRGSLISFWLTGATLCVSAHAAAQEGKVFPECTRSPSESDISAAKGAFEAGQVSFQEADYARAILYWEDAFRRDCTALALLLNLSRAYELAGAKLDAISALETYLERRPHATDREQISRRIDVLKRQLEEERSQEEPSPPPTSEPPSEEPAPVAAPIHDPGTPSMRPVWPLVVAGTGLATGVIGTVLWTTNQSSLDSAYGECRRVGDDDYVCPHDSITQDANAARRDRNIGIGLTIGGSLIAVGGTVAYFVLRNQPKQTAVLTPSVGPGFAGLSYSRLF